MEKYKLRLGNTLYFCREDFHDNLEILHGLGFDTVDFNIASLWHKPEQEAEYYARLEEGMEDVLRLGMAVNGIHMSFGRSWDISSLDESVRRQAVEKSKSIFDRTGMLDPYCYIFHPSFEPISEEKREEHIEAVIRSVRELSSETDTLICLETLPRSCLMNTSLEAIRIIDSIDLPGVKVCVDVNHFLKEKSEDAVLALGDRIATTHISDHDYVNERHMMPGCGLIDWMGLIGAFEKIGYNGVFNYEVEGTGFDVKENYRALFEEYNKMR